MDDEDETIQKEPPFYDGYVLLIGDQTAIDDIVRSRPAKRPGYLLKDTVYKAFIPLSAPSWEAFDAKVAAMIGGRLVEPKVLRVPADPRALYPCPIKRSALGEHESLAFGLVNAASLEAGDIDEALRAVQALRIGPAARVDGVPGIQILVELQAPTLDLPDTFDKLRKCPKISPPSIIPARPLAVTDPSPPA